MILIARFIMILIARFIMILIARFIMILIARFIMILICNLKKWHSFQAFARRNSSRTSMSSFPSLFSP
jgi:hypothetical protein